MFGIYRDSYRYAETAMRQTIARHEAQSQAPTAAMTELESKPKRAIRSTPRHHPDQSPPGVVAVDFRDDLSSLADSSIHPGEGKVSKDDTVQLEVVPRSARIRQITDSIQSAVSEFESFETEILRDIHTTKDLARGKLHTNNSMAAVRCMKRIRRLQVQSKHVSHHIEQLEGKLQAIHCAERNATVVHTLGGDTDRDQSLNRLLDDLQHEVDTAREMRDILDTPFVDSNVDDEALLAELREEETFSAKQGEPQCDVRPSTFTSKVLTPSDGSMAQSEHSLWC